MVKRVNAAPADAPDAAQAEPPPDAAQAEPPPAAELGDFADLMQAAQAAEGIAPPAEAAPPAEPTPQAFAAEARELIEVAAELVLPFVADRWGDELAKAYGPRQRDAIALAVGKVAHKRGWTLDKVLAGYGPELALCAAIAAPALPIVMRRARLKREAAAAPPADTLPAPPAEPPRPAQPANDGRIL